MEIPVCVEKRNAILDTPGCNDDVDRLANGYPFTAKASIVGSTLTGNTRSNQWHDTEAGKSCLNARHFHVPRTLKNLCQDQITKKYFFPSDQSLEMSHLRCLRATEEIDPHRCIN